MAPPVAGWPCVLPPSRGTGILLSPAAPASPPNGRHALPESRRGGGPPPPALRPPAAPASSRRPAAPHPRSAVSAPFRLPETRRPGAPCVLPGCRIPARSPAGPPESQRDGTPYVLPPAAAVHSVAEFLEAGIDDAFPFAAVFAFLPKLGKAGILQEPSKELEEGVLLLLCARTGQGDQQQNSKTKQRYG
ncbi:vegetative cell wall protein gp1-like [Setaria italica]|uniref:vegetative cell wall protein gp1-like n=1 Tax=Setaria italica TaxID=4555 RepID=UPI0006481245|nr:vegetative cell wall protein gp1-like [Setaria italica]